VDADLATNEVDVTVSGSDLDEAPDGQAYLKVVGPNGTASQQISSTQTITLTESDIGTFSSGETITATLYESSSESNQIAQGSDTTPSVTITEIDATETNAGGSGDVVVTVTGSNIENNAVSIRIEDSGTEAGSGDAPSKTDTITDLDQGEQSTTINFDADDVYDSETLTVTVYETSNQNYELANQTTTGGDTYTN
jgi:hypothetical protein